MSKVKKFSDYLPYCGMIDDGIIITKDAILLRTYKVYSQDLSFQTDSTINTILRDLNNTFRQCDEGWIIYIDSVRRKSTDITEYFDAEAPMIAKEFDKDRKNSIGEYYYTEFFITLGFVIPQNKGINKFLFKSNSNHSPFTKHITDFTQISEDIFNMYFSVFRNIVKLDSSEMLRYLHSLHGENHPVKMPECGFYLDHFLSDALFYPDSVCRLNNDYILTASIKDFPDSTRKEMISNLMSLNIEFRVSTRFTFLSKASAKKEINSIRRTHFQKRKGVGSLLTESILKEETQLHDTEALSLTNDASEALSLLSGDFLQYGYLTTALIVRHPDYEIAKENLNLLKKVCNDMQFIVKEESFNNPLVFLGSLPGNLWYNSRKPLISTRNLAHFFPISDKWQGEQQNILFKSKFGVGQPLMLTKAGNTLFYLNLHVGQVGHTLICGPTGSGKSILLNTLAYQFLRYPNSRIIFFDKDKSSQYPCKNINGIFVDIGSPDSEMKFNPFYHIDKKSEQYWLCEFLIIYLKSKITITKADENKIAETLDNMSTQPKVDLCFTYFQDAIQVQDIRDALEPFVTGEYSDLFCTGNDDFSMAKWITFEMASLMSRGKEITNFILNYMFHKIELQFVIDGDPALLVLDEAWLFLNNEKFSAAIQDWLKTLRKKNVSVLLATQELADAEKSDNSIFSTIVASCPTKILLPNPQAHTGLNSKLYAEIGLTSDDICAIEEGVQQQDYFYFSTLGKQKFRLDLTEIQLDILKTAL